MQLFKKILLFISAFIPLYALLLVKIGIQIANDNLHFNVLNTIMICFLSLLILVGALGIYLALKCKKYKKITVKTAQNTTEKHFLGYLSLFVLFALNFEIEYMAMAVVFVLILVFVGIVYIKNNLFYINPTLNILGFSFYEITYFETDSHEVKTDYVLSKTKLFSNKTYYISFLHTNLAITLGYKAIKKLYLPTKKP